MVNGEVVKTIILWFLLIIKDLEEEESRNSQQDEAWWCGNFSNFVAAYLEQPRCIYDCLISSYNVMKWIHILHWSSSLELTFFMKLW